MDDSLRRHYPVRFKRSVAASAALSARCAGLPRSVLPTLTRRRPVAATPGPEVFAPAGKSGKADAPFARGVAPVPAWSDFPPAGNRPAGGKGPGTGGEAPERGAEIGLPIICRLMKINIMRIFERVWEAVRAGGGRLRGGIVRRGRFRRFPA
ncbi:hypothetical protein GCM10010517_46550 [Streptosporangium fragile]|uniref:Uncharacterized protein n=1 Tax=Streptosporangium fragile TaxID=46186 RepID=A0ABP6IK23_9ACTN